MATASEVIAARWERSQARAQALHLSEVCDTFRTQDLGQDENLAPVGDPQRIHKGLACCVISLKQPQEVEQEGKVMGIATAAVYVPVGTTDLLSVDMVTVTSPTTEGSAQPRCFDVIGVSEEDSTSNLLTIYVVRRR